MTDRTHGPFTINGQEVFPPGTCCVIVDSNIGGKGLECTVIRFRTDDMFGPVYDIDVNHPVKVAMQSALRRRPPKSDQSQWIREATTTWDKCDWRPSGVVA